MLGPPLMTFTENTSTRVRTRTQIEKRLEGFAKAKVFPFHKNEMLICLTSPLMKVIQKTCKVGSVWPLMC